MMVPTDAARLRLTLARWGGRPGGAADQGGDVEAAIEVPGLIALKGKVVATDALPCTAIAARPLAILQGGGADCLALKANQAEILSDARSGFGKVLPDHPVAHHEEARHHEEAGHGRKEACTGTVVSARGLAEHHDFPGLQAFGRIEARRETDEKVQTRTRCYALSRVPAPEVYGHRPRPSGHPERPALAASRLVSGRCRPQPQGSRPRQHRRPAPPRPRSRPTRHLQRLALDQTEARRLERCVSSQPSQSVSHP